MTIEQNDNELERALRAHYDALLSGVQVPERLRHEVLGQVERKRGYMASWGPIVGLALASASFLVVLASSRLAEVVFHF